MEKFNLGIEFEKVERDFGDDWRKACVCFAMTELLLNLVKT